MEFPRLGGKVPLEDKPNAFAEPRARESDVPIGVIAIGGVDGPVGLMMGVRVVLLEEINSLFSSFPVVVGGPGEVFVRGICRNAEEVVSLHQGSREGMDGDGLEIGRRGDELEDVIDVVLLDGRGIHFRCGGYRVVFHFLEGVLIRSETSWGRGIVVVNTVRWEGGENHEPVFPGTCPGTHVIPPPHPAMKLSPSKQSFASTAARLFVLALLPLASLAQA